MDQVRAEIEPLLEVVRHHVPPELLDHALIAAGLGGLIGLILALWGVRVFRSALVLAFVGGGVLVGLAGNQWVNLGQWFCVICGGLVFGALGFVLYRLWVGVGWAALLVCVGLSAFGHKQAWPHWDAFSEARLSDTILADQGFQPPTVEEQGSFNEPDPLQVFREFGGYLNENVPNIRRNALVTVSLAGVLGLLMGLLAVKFTVVLATAFIGVSLLAGAAGYFLSRFQPQVLDQAMSKPAAVWAGLGIVVLVSMMIQYFQTRPRPVAEAGTTTNSR
ncbi:MAG: hypothetical protein JSU68_02350 [Phycisphaerales bacterium]|nr:MAG: hypothetical protein JSU68_02350 [Phycisphaerales bacterium]